MPQQVRPKAGTTGNFPRKLTSTSSHDAALLSGLQFTALGSHFYGPGLACSFRGLWERLRLSTDLGAVITILPGEDLGFSLGHIISRGRPWQGGAGGKQSALFTRRLTELLVQVPKSGANTDPEHLKLELVLTGKQAHGRQKEPWMHHLAQPERVS